MPTYEYVCENGHPYTEYRGMLVKQVATECPECGAALMRKFNAAPIRFKGRGFYSSSG